MRFSPRAGDATIFKKIASPSQAKNRSCSRGLMPDVAFVENLSNRSSGVQIPWDICTRFGCYLCSTECS